MKIGSKLEHTYALCNCFADTRKLIKSSVVNSMLMLMNCNTEASARVTQSRWSVRSGGKKGSRYRNRRFSRQRCMRPRTSPLKYTCQSRYRSKRDDKARLTSRSRSALVTDFRSRKYFLVARRDAEDREVTLARKDPRE